MRMLLAEGALGSQQSLNLRARDRWSTALVGVATAALMVAPFAWTGWMLLAALAAILLVVALNHQFYRFLAEVQRPWAVVGMVPLHMLFYFVSGLCVPVGYFKHVTGASAAPPEAKAAGVRSVQIWPPPATHLPSSIFSLRPADPSRQP
jgi:hypothetical protein